MPPAGLARPRPGEYRPGRSRPRSIEDLAGWPTTVAARVCLDLLRSRQARREEPLDPQATAPLVSRDSGSDPENEALLAGSVGLALLVVLGTLAPAERIAFVLHHAGLAGQREVVATFLAALRGGDLDGLLAVLDPDLVVRADQAAAGAAVPGAPLHVHRGKDRQGRRDRRPREPESARAGACRR